MFFMNMVLINYLPLSSSWLESVSCNDKLYPREGKSEEKKTEEQKIRPFI